MSVNYPSLKLDAPGPWTGHRIADRTLYMRVNVAAARVTVRYDEVGNLRDLAAVCDLNLAGRARVVVNPHQAHWALESVQRDLLERASALWRRHGTDQTGNVLTFERDHDTYELWADRQAQRVEITRRPSAPGEVEVGEYLGFGDGLGHATATIRLSRSVPVPNGVLLQLQALVRQCWQQSRDAETASPAGSLATSGTPLPQDGGLNADR